MKIFLDANVIISVLNKEYPVFTVSSRILSLADNPRFKVYTSALSLAICFYFVSKKSGEKQAKQKINRLKEHVSLAVVSEDVVNESLRNPAVNDLEDGMQYYAAENAECTCIITENPGDFYFSNIEVLTCEDFFRRYMIERKHGVIGN